MVLVDQRQELPYLVRLGLTTYRLEVQPLTSGRTPIDVVASPNTVQLETASLNQPPEIGESDVLEITVGDPVEEPSWIHRRTVPGMSDTPRGASGSLRRLVSGHGDRQDDGDVDGEDQEHQAQHHEHSAPRVIEDEDVLEHAGDHHIGEQRPGADDAERLPVE